MSLRFASWNVACSGQPRLVRQLDYVRDLGCDLVAFQELSEQGCDVLEQSTHYPHVWHSRALRPRGRDETSARGRFCAIAATETLKGFSEPTLLSDAAAPERTLSVSVSTELGVLSIASFHQVAASDRRKWGPEAKAQTFRAISGWMERQTTLAVAGMDLNSPRVDHPDVTRNEYFYDRRPDDQLEHFLHDSTRARHGLRDVLRDQLASDPEELDRITKLRPEGPLAISHVVRGTARRFDFIYVTPDLRGDRVEYDESVLEASNRLSDHALVIADLSIRDEDNTCP